MTEPTAHAGADPAPSLMVHVGRDGWLFLVHGTNDVLAQYGREGFPRDLLARWRHLLEARRRLCRGHRARYFNVVVPEKLAVYDHKLDGLSVDVRMSPSARLRRALRWSGARWSHVDLLRAFRAHRDRVPLYLKTDTHWSHAGCHLAYAVICRRLGVRSRAALADPSHRESGPVTGDLGLKFEPPRGEVAQGWRFPRAARRVHANGLLRHFEDQGHACWGGVGTQVVYRNDAADVDPRRLIVFGDSYAHQTWLPRVGALTVMLAETFREVHFIWATAIDWRYVEAVRPDVVLTEIAERFMIELPPLGVDIAALETAAIRRKVGGAG